jgi:hypothetical protein
VQQQQQHQEQQQQQQGGEKYLSALCLLHHEVLHHQVPANLPAWLPAMLHPSATLSRAHYLPNSLHSHSSPSHTVDPAFSDVVKRGHVLQAV